MRHGRFDKAGTGWRVIVWCVLVIASALSLGAARAESPPAFDFPAPDTAPAWDSGSVTFIGTATVLVRYAGFTILTDPNFLHRGEEVELGYGLRSRRLTDPAIPIESLPPIDFVLLSHFHEDHFDKRVQAKLDRNLPIVTTVHGVRQLKKLGFKFAVPLKAWQTLELRKGTARLRITAMPARHGPSGVRQALPPVMGSMLEFMPAPDRVAYRSYISGDTLMFDDLQEIPQRYPQIDLALLHLGGTRAAGILVTMDGLQGVQTLGLINPDKAIPIHYNDYTVFKSPLSEFLKQAEAAGLANKVHVLKHGESYSFSVPASRWKSEQ